MHFIHPIYVSFSDYSDTDDNQEMHNYFRLASAHLKEILKTPGVWDPFIVSYVEVRTQVFGKSQAAYIIFVHTQLNAVKCI